MRGPRWRAFKLWLLLALLCALGLSIWWLHLSGPAAPAIASLLTDEERAWLAEHPVLRLAPDPNFPPIEYFDETGHYRGLIADYYPLIEARLGLRFQLVRAATWDEVLNLAKRREVDILGAAQQTPARSEYLNFSQAIIDIPNVVIVPRQVEGVVDFSRLAGKRLAITRGNALDEYVRANFPAIRVVAVADDLAGLRDVSFGRSDATVVNLAIASYLIGKHGIANLRVAGDSGRSNALHIASRNDWPILNQILAKGLASITEAEHQEIYRRWIKLDDRINTRQNLMLLLGTGALFTLVVIVVLLFNRSLRRQVDARTAALNRELAERGQAEDALRQSIEVFEAIQLSITETILLTDLQGNIISANPTAAQRLGRPLPETIGGNIFRLLPAHVAQERRAYFDAVIRSKKPFTTDDDRNGRSYFATYFPVLDSQGEVSAIAVIATDVIERKQAENLQLALHSISEASHSALDLPTLLEQIHQIIGNMMPAKNFYVALYNESTGEISFPYFVDEHDPVPSPRKFGAGGLTDVVLRTGEALLLTPESQAAVAGEENIVLGSDSLDWLGVPLKTEKRTVGVLAVQTYSAHVRYTERDKTLLQFVSEQVAMSIERAQAEKARFDSAEELRVIYDTASVAIFEGDLSGDLIHANRRMAEMFRCPLEKLIGSEYVAHIHPDEREAGRQNLLGLLTGDLRTVDLERRYRREDGSEFWGHLTARQRLDSQGKVVALVGVITDITERKQAEAHLQLAANVFTYAQEGITITDAEGNIIDVNDTFTRITGYSRVEAIGKNPRILKSGRQDQEFYAGMWSDLKTKGHWSGEIWNRRKTGEVYVEMLNISAVTDAAGVPQNYVALFSDISSLKEHQNQLERIAHYDALTGLPNRVVLADRLRQATAQTRRRENLMALVYLDLDGFKEVNDNHGHETGDALLIVLSQRLKEALREGDTLARIGGDEFVAVLTDLTSIRECEVVLSRLLQAAASPVQIKEITLRVSASLGVTLFPLDSGDPDTLLRHADQAMYQAKQAGKNRYHLFDQEHDKLTRSHQESYQRIAQALEDEEFVLYYQPKVNMREGRVIGVEALIRWQHPERGVVAPGEFLPVIEGSELISKLGDWVLNTALEQMAAWARDGFEIAVSVNIAAHHLQQHDFLDGLKEKLALHRSVTARNLELELLETAALEDVLHVSQVIKDCQALGVTISLDDFGTGYSSLTYLKRLPADILKIDQSFVQDMLWDTEDLSIVEGVIGLAAAFHRTVIAEGVETTEHGQMLLKLGCDYGQGYGIARPMPADKLIQWTREWQQDPSWAACRDLVLNRNELPLVYAEVDHRYWVRWMGNWLTGVSDRPPPFDSHHCRFGAWYHGEGSNHYGHMPEFQAIDAVHEEVHQLGQELVAHKSANRLNDAQAAFVDLNTLRDKLIGKLLALSAALSQGRK
ncbi:MAG: EAL domain-containing protein [Sterolibacterium sp.]|jgi:diguanylate cyclase (GGDEF)-like protein/PAS domain S-box-containing protein